MAQHYAIAERDEARAYLAHPLLGSRYVECVSALQDLIGSDAVAVFSDIDAVKLRSSLTLFEAVSGRALFGAALDRWSAASATRRRWRHCNAETKSVPVRSRHRIPAAHNVPFISYLERVFRRAMTRDQPG